MSKEKTAAIRKELKEAGYSSRQVGVRGRCSLYDYTIDVIIKDLNVNESVVKSIAQKFEKIDYCQASGEILAGANDYVFVKYDHDLMHNEIEKNLDVGTDLWNTIKNATENTELINTGRFCVVYYVQEREVCILRRPDDYKTRSCYCLDTLERCHVGNEYTAANIIVSLGMVIANEDTNN
jgi:hypothetical protein